MICEGGRLPLAMDRQISAQYHNGMHDKAAAALTLALLAAQEAKGKAWIRESR